MGAIFPMPILEQEMSAERWIAIPQPVQDVLKLWRPTPLVRALNLGANPVRPDDVAVMMLKRGGAHALRTS